MNLEDYLRMLQKMAAREKQRNEALERQKLIDKKPKPPQE